MKLFLIFFSSFILFYTVETKSNLTLDAFFNYTTILSLSLSPNGQYLLIQTQRAAWDSNSFEHSLWLYDTVESRKKLITNKLLPDIKFQWSPSGRWVVFLLKNYSTSNNFAFQRLFRIASNAEQNIYLYSVESDQVKSIPIGNETLTAVTWSQNDSSLYYASFDFNSNENSEWKNIIQYPSDPTSIIRRINIDTRNDMSFLTTNIANIPFQISELVYNPMQENLIFTSVSLIMEDIDIFQIYSIDLKNVSSITKLKTIDHSVKQNLQLTTDSKRLLFHTLAYGSADGSANLTEPRVYSIDLTNNLVERWASDFQGHFMSYTIKSNGGIYFLGQVGINVQIYSQTSPKDILVLHDGLHGSYQLISSSPSVNSVAFVFSSFSKAQEAYLITDINQLKSAVPITIENYQYDQINLPKAQAYHWTNNEDNQTIEGILHYPPGRFQEKNLPLFVLIHGGPTAASLNSFVGNGGTWAPMAAAEGWLVLEPNYRGSTGYGDQFVNAIRCQPTTLPGKDILSGINRLIEDGIADRNKLAVGGYSYGGVLTNWLITQTTRFNAALSGAGSIEQVAFWGMTDIPVYIATLFGGLPWMIPHIYQNESPIYHFDKIRTPTHIVTGADDIRMPVSQNLMFERAFRYLKVPFKLLLIPNEGHSLSNNPWYQKIKVREEIKWLQLYGYNFTVVENE